MTDSPEPVTTREAVDLGGESGGPYKSLLVPLVLVPAMIVMVAVLIAALFGLLSGSERSPEDNLNQLLSGGANEKQQAAFGLVRQLLEYQHARREGREPEWGIDESFRERLHAARAALDAPRSPDEVWVPFVLSSLSAQLGDSDGVLELIDVVHLDDGLDPEFTFRTNAIFILGSIGGDLGEADQKRAAEAMIELLQGDDDGLAWLAAGALQNLPSPGTVSALEGLLGSRRIDMRLQAALSLAELGQDSGVDVLLELVSEEPYLAEHGADPTRWAPQTVSATRLKVLTALRDLGRLPARSVLKDLSEDGSDPNVRSLALELLSDLEG